MEMPKSTGTSGHGKVIALNSGSEFSASDFPTIPLYDLTSYIFCRRNA